MRVVVCSSWVAAYVFACDSAACAPPPAGTGGSSGGSAPKTVSEFRKQSVESFKRANPDVKGAKFTWVRKPKAVTWAFGDKGFTGSFRVEAPGFRTKVMHATHVAGGSLMVR